MSDLGYAAKIWIAERSSSQVVLAPSLEDGVPEPLSPAVSLFRASYVSVAEAQADLLTQAGSILQDTYATLAVRFLSPDGPPNQVLILFDPGGKEQITYRVGSRAHDKVPCDAYRVVTTRPGRPWDSDVRGGGFGYFLVGASQRTNLWRITRVEPDNIGRCQFTVVPVLLPHGLPVPKFHVIEAPLRHEIALHWMEMERAYIEHRSYALVTAAKNIGEGLLYWKLRDRLGVKRPDMGKMLPVLSSLLKDKASCDTAPFSWLDFHILSKLRVLHERTHPERATRERLTPELALCSAHEIVVILRSLGLAE